MGSTLSLHIAIRKRIKIIKERNLVVNTRSIALTQLFRQLEDIVTGWWYFGGKELEDAELLRTTLEQIVKVVDSLEILMRGLD